MPSIFLLLVSVGLVVPSDSVNKVQDCSLDALLTWEGEKRGERERNLREKHGSQGRGGKAKRERKVAGMGGKRQKEKNGREERRGGKRVKWVERGLATKERP